MELGIYTFGDIVPDPKTSRVVSGQERMRQMLDMAKLADEAGLDICQAESFNDLRQEENDPVICGRTREINEGKRKDARIHERTPKA